jgi:AAA15 family ATPase/GTPase
MKLQKFSYKEYETSPRYWELKEFQLNNINLIVGNNTSGKSRTLNVINGLARLLLSPKIQFNSGTYKGCFEEKDNQISYGVEFSNGNIIEEYMYQNKTPLFKRDKNGIGEILNVDIKQKMKFKIPINELVAYRRDDIQFPYLNSLYHWASNTRHFRFSREQDKQTLGLIDSNKTPTESFNLKESNQAIEVFRVAKGKYRDLYVKMLIGDFNKIGYDVSDIDVGIMHSIKVDAPMGNKVIGLRVNENDREGITDQNEMSDGMFRALSILIHYNYYILEKKNLTILIDDIGEGLDFERSSKLIQLLTEKSNNNNIQLIMSTNDKFVMNHTSLDYWQAISRKGGVVQMFNKFNSSKEFEDFRFTGLNNFDFFSTEFFKTGLE